MHNAKRLILWICCLVAVCGVWAAVYYQVVHDKSQAKAAAETNAQNLAKAFEEHVLATVRHLDSTLLILRDSSLQRPASFLEQLAIFKRTLPDNLITQVSVIDARGVIVFSELRLPDAQTDLSDREHFRFQRDSKEDALFISKPVIGRVSGKWSLVFTRKILRRDGGFGGVVSVSVAPEFFSSFFRSVDLGRNGVVSLIGTDHVIRARSRVGIYPSDAKGQLLPADRPCFDPGRPAAGTYVLPSSTDRLSRVWSYRRLRSYPLIVSVGLDENEIYGATRARRANLVIWGGCISALLLMATGMILWLDRQQDLSEQSLREAKQRLELATASARLGVWDWDLARAALTWDARMHELFGLAPGSFSGKVEDFQKALHPDDLAATLQAIRSALKGEKQFNTEYRAVHPDGAVKIIKADGLVIRDPGGKAIRMIGLNREITARMSMMHALRESEARFKTLADATFEGIAITEQGRYVDVNAQLARMLGYQRDELIGLEVAATLPPQERAQVLSSINAGRASHLEHEIQCKDDSSRFVESHGRSVVQNGRELRITAIRDITERKRMERALHESEEQFRTLCDAAPIGIFRADSRGNTNYCNPRWEEITGLPASEGTGKGWLKSVHPDDLENLLKLISAPVTRDGILSHELRHLTPAGKTIWVRLLVSPVHDPQGDIICHVGTMEDITEIRQARQELLKNQKLESLGVLAGGIAHDFNNILTAVFGNISLARLQLDDPQALAQRLEDAENAIVRATDLTRQLLTFSRGGAPVKKIIKLDDLLRESANFVLHGSNVSCVFQLPDEIWAVEADAGQLSQVIHNLMLNAVQAMPDGGTVTIGVEQACSPPDGERLVRISVADTGPGIAESNLLRIFDPYYTTKPQGNGLGLATCYSIIKRHGGKIRAASKPGEGSSFIISLPASEQQCGAEAKPEGVLVRGSGRVLVMDDDGDIRTLARGILQELGFTVECAGHGAQAIELYLRAKELGAPFCAVILDLTIPGGIGGKETIARLLEIDPGVKGIVSSGYSNDKILADYRDYGFRAVLNKPYRAQEMSAVLRELVGA